MADEENVGAPPNARDNSQEESHEGEKVPKKSKKSPKRTDSAATASRVDAESEHEDESEGDAVAGPKDTASPDVDTRATPREVKAEGKAKAGAEPKEAKPWGLVSRLRFERRVGKRRF
jgi:hypothetical protein